MLKEDTNSTKQKEDDLHSLNEDAGVGVEEELQQGQSDIDDDSFDAHQQLEQVIAEKEELNRNFLRLQADFDNFRKRSRKEQQEFMRYASQSLIEKLLPVIDNFERALSSDDSQSQSFKAGIEMIYKQLVGILEQEGLVEIETEGQDFDPNFHEAVMQVKNDECPDNMVIEVMQKGYKLKDKVVRPAMVKVANN
ncbi:nucleotide exchange factor GrpE [Metallumcola ferriviriculae]|uniref:Protein GrpE n=1 Tax=Metallumcola ferriviriculae TaxID=3039180 RepID=A0AAU0UK41_9FIRM|nr:nucleotide exchange factor GrpE [Desulfitibacteraceae bacterium MK1]